MAAEPTSSLTGLPVGSAVVFISDEHVDGLHVRRASSFRAHLRSDLLLGDTLLAPAGAPVRLIVDRRPTPTPAPNTDVSPAPPNLAIELEGFHVVGGLLPVAPRPALVHAIDVGTEIPAVTLGIVERVGSRTQVRIPLPVPLGSDVPAVGFTPMPAQTPRYPASGRRTPSPSPAP